MKIENAKKEFQYVKIIIKENLYIIPLVVEIIVQDMKNVKTLSQFYDYIASKVA